MCSPRLSTAPLVRGTGLPVVADRDLPCASMVSVHIDSQVSCILRRHVPGIGDFFSCWRKPVHIGTRHHRTAADLHDGFKACKDGPCCAKCSPREHYLLFCSGQIGVLHNITCLPRSPWPCSLPIPSARLELRAPVESINSVYRRHDDARSRCTFSV